MAKTGRTAIVIGVYTEVPIRKRAKQDDIGAGVGGIATAARLAKAGFQVTVLEKNDFSGGRCSLLHHDGYVGSALPAHRHLLTLSCHSDSTKVPLSSSFPTYSTNALKILAHP